MLVFNHWFGSELSWGGLGWCGVGKGWFVLVSIVYWWCGDWFVVVVRLAWHYLTWVWPKLVEYWGMGEATVQNFTRPALSFSTIYPSLFSCHLSLPFSLVWDARISYLQQKTAVTISFIGTRSWSLLRFSHFHLLASATRSSVRSFICWWGSSVAFHSNSNNSCGLLLTLSPDRGLDDSAGWGSSFWTRVSFCTSSPQHLVSVLLTVKTLWHTLSLGKSTHIVVLTRTLPTHATLSHIMFSSPHLFITQSL